MPITDFLQPCDEVDAEMYLHFLEGAAPQYLARTVFQAGEANYEERGRYHYMTFSEMDEKYFYLGILPAFKQPKY